MGCHGNRLGEFRKSSLKATKQAPSSFARGDSLETDVPGFAFALIIGYFLKWINIRPGYMLMGLVLICLWCLRKANKAKKQRLKDEKPESVAPPQVSFANIERLVASNTEEGRQETLNKVMAELWPHISIYLKNLLKDRIEPLVQGSHSALSSFHFTLINFGKSAPRVTSVITGHKKSDRKQIILDIGLNYHGDAKVEMTLRKDMIKVGINGAKLEGTLRVILEPLLDSVPFVGAVTFYFPQRPKLHVNWTGLAEMLKLPGLNSLSDTKVIDQIAKFIVLPNHMTIPLNAGIKVDDLYYKVHRNVIRVIVLEANGLMAKDFITRKSDPYVIVHCGGQTNKTKVVYRNLNPCWNQVFDMSFSDLPGQKIDFEVYDFDLEKDDFLGSCQISVKEVMKQKSIDTWIPLKNVVSGKLHVKLESLSLLSQAAQLRPVLMANQRYCLPKSEVFSSALLFVFIDRARGLQLKEGDKNPSSKAEIKVHKSVQKTKICPNTIEPVWGETFTFLIRNPHNEVLELQVRDTHDGLLGSISVPLSTLLCAGNLTTEDWYQLSSSGTDSGAVRMRLSSTSTITKSAASTARGIIRRGIRSLRCNGSSVTAARQVGGHTFGPVGRKYDSSALEGGAQLQSFIDCNGTTLSPHLKHSSSFVSPQQKVPGPQKGVGEDRCWQVVS
uniref:Extended synaptotagmin-like protein 3 n=1 Tax=Xenopus tropicalis TaxID=8364 RepID=A0A6I8QRL5_XENTR